MKKIYLLPIFFGLALLFYAFSVKEVSVKISGTVLHPTTNQPLTGVRVFVVEEGNETEELPYFEPTDINGSFVLDFNALEGKEVTLLFERKGFHSFKYFHQQKNNTPETQLPTITLLPKIASGDISGTLKSEIKVFKDIKSTSYEIFDSSSIKFIDYLEETGQVVFDEKCEAQKTWYKLSLTFQDGNSEEDKDGYVML